MKLINLDAFVAGLEREIQRKREERNHAAENEWFDKAANHGKLKVRGLCSPYVTPPAAKTVTLGVNVPRTPRYRGSVFSLKFKLSVVS